MKENKKTTDSSKKTKEKSIKKDDKKLWIKRKSDWLMDDLGEEVLSLFKELGFDKEYIQDKHSILAGKNRFAVLLWCNELDTIGKAALADRLGIEVDDFNTTLKTLTKL
jgi:phosphoglycerate-specific signal transduction histidine kinase